MPAARPRIKTTFGSEGSAAMLAIRSFSFVMVRIGRLVVIISRWMPPMGTTTALVPTASLGGGASPTAWP